VLLVDLFLPERRRVLTYWLSLAALCWARPRACCLPPRTGGSSRCSGAYVTDPLAQLLKLFTCGVVAVTFLYSRDYLRQRGCFKGEYYVLGLFATLGIFVMISAHSMLSLYLGLELMSLSLYAMVAFNRDSPMAAEAAMKYFILGADRDGLLPVRHLDPLRRHRDLDLGEMARRAAELDALDTCRCWWRCPSSWSGWRSSSARCRSTCGCPTSTRARARRSRCSSAPPPRSPRWR
jgi:NADH-quinone oxidoreductase subunit N